MRQLTLAEPMTSSASHGRRTNGLPASDWGALVDLDPRLSENLLDRLAEAGVAAYVEPAGMTADPASRAVLLPKRPMDRLWVDPARADDARAVVVAEISELTARLAQDNPSATADGFIQPVPRAAAARVLAPPELPERISHPVSAESGAAGPPDDDDEVFRQIVAGFDRDHGLTATPWPAAENVPDGAQPGPTTPALDSREPGTAEPAQESPRGRSLRRRSKPVDQPGADLPGWLEPEALDDDGHYEPPPPPPVPRFTSRTIGSLLAILGGLLLTFAPNVVGLYDSPALGFVGVLCFVGGAGSLVWALHDPSGNDPDDGAVV